MVSALQAGKQVPPVVVMATDRGRGFGLIDTRHGGLAPVPRASDRDWKVAEGSLRAWPCCQSYRLDREDMPLLGHAFKRDLGVGLRWCEATEEAPRYAGR
jgi:hypothetical protein